MRMLLVLAFDTESGAREMINQVQARQRQQLLIVSDAALVIRQMDDKVKVKQVNSLVGSGAWGGAFWGLLVGLLLGQSLPSSALRDVSDYGLDKRFVNQIRLTVKPGTSALFLMISHVLKDEVLAELAEYPAQQLRLRLSLEDEIKMRDAFGVVDEY